MWDKIAIKLSGIIIVFMAIWGFSLTSYGVVLSTVDESVKTVFPDAADIKKETKVLTQDEKNEIAKKADVGFSDEFDNEFIFYIASSNGKIDGYAVENTVKGKWGPIRYMVAMSPDGAIKDVIIMEYTEKRGKPIAGERFRSQFHGKSSKDDVNIRKDIKAVSGATISSRGVTDGVRKLLHVFHKYYGTGA